MEEPDTAARPRYVLPAPGSAGGGVQGAAPGLPSRYTIMALIEGRPGEVGVAMCSLDAMGAPFELISITEDGEYRQAVSLALVSCKRRGRTLLAAPSSPLHSRSHSFNFLFLLLLLPSCRRKSPLSW